MHVFMDTLGEKLQQLEHYLRSKLVPVNFSDGDIPTGEAVAGPHQPRRISRAAIADVLHEACRRGKVEMVWMPRSKAKTNSSEYRADIQSPASTQAVDSPSFQPRTARHHCRSN